MEAKDEAKQTAEIASLGAEKRLMHRESVKRCKKQKLDEHTTYDDLLKDWTQCCFLMLHKRRLCNIGRAPNSLYCGNHTQVSKNAADAEENERAGERIPCPVDPSHTIYLRNKDAHVKVCNSGKRSQWMKSLPYYCLNCNGGSLNQDTQVEAEVNADELLSKIKKAFESVEISEPLSTSFSDIEQLGDRIRRHVGGGQSSFVKLRHVEQDVVLVQQMIAFGLLKVSEDSSIAYAEFGAGKGLLTQSIHAVNSAAQFYLIERSGNRRKIDRFLQSEKGKVERLRMDIRHCFLPHVPGICEPGRKVVAVAKHLCGVASDLAIRGLSHISPREHGLTRGLALATCCHHACQYVDYVGTAWLNECGISAAEFNILRKWSGWAHLDRSNPARRGLVATEDQDQDQDQEHSGIQVHDHDVKDMPVLRPSSVTAETMPDVGRMVKRVLDYGRVLFLRDVMGMEVQYVQYCDTALSPECMAILARDAKTERFSS